MYDTIASVNIRLQKLENTVELVTGGSEMNLDELRNALETGEEIEYHLMGMEHNAGMLGKPGWYRCYVSEILLSGNIEIGLIDSDWGVTVLNKNLSIAFRRVTG